MLHYTNLNMLMVFVTPYLQIHHKIEGNEGNRTLRAKKFAEIRRQSHWPSFCQRHRGFDRVPMGCRARDRVGPKGGRR